MVGKDGVLDSMQTVSVQSEAPSEADLRVPVEGKEKKENKLTEGNNKVCLKPVFHLANLFARTSKKRM